MARCLNIPELLCGVALLVYFGYAILGRGFGPDVHEICDHSGLRCPFGFCCKLEILLGRDLDLCMGR